jgi:hypothetical protein
MLCTILAPVQLRSLGEDPLYYDFEYLPSIIVYNIQYI